MKIVVSILSTIAVLAVGGLIGAGIALLVAPASGRATRARLYSEGVGLKEKVSDEVVVTRSHLKNRLHGLASDARIRATGVSGRLHEVTDHPGAVLKHVFGAIPVRANGR